MSPNEVFISILKQLFINRSSIEINTQVFSWENVFGPPQKPWLWTEKKTEGTSSAMFGVGTGTKCCELKRCADRVRSRTQERESPQR